MVWVLLVFDLGAFDACSFIVFYDLDFRLLRYQIAFLVGFDVCDV